MTAGGVEALCPLSVSASPFHASDKWLRATSPAFDAFNSRPTSLIVKKSTEFGVAVPSIVGS